MVNSIKSILFRSMNIPTVDLQSSIEVLIFSTSSNIASDVDIFFLNPFDFHTECFSPQ